MSPRREYEPKDLEPWVDWLADHYSLDHRIIRLYTIEGVAAGADTPSRPRADWLHRQSSN